MLVDHSDEICRSEKLTGQATFTGAHLRASFGRQRSLFIFDPRGWRFYLTDG